MRPPGLFQGGTRTSGNFCKPYPDTTAGYMIRWAWGISRIIDALQALPEARIDVSRIAVTGCSYQSKIALYAGAFDERIALTISQESGGGGTISWRYSDKLEKRDHTEVENLLHAQGAPWYAAALRQFTPALEAYLDKLGKQDVNTDILRSKFTDLDRATWIPWTSPELK